MHVSRDQIWTKPKHSIRPFLLRTETKLITMWNEEKAKDTVDHHLWRPKRVKLVGVDCRHNISGNKMKRRHPKKYTREWRKDTWLDLSRWRILNPLHPRTSKWRGNWWKVCGQGSLRRRCARTQMALRKTRRWLLWNSRHLRRPMRLSMTRMDTRLSSNCEPDSESLHYLCPPRSRCRNKDTLASKIPLAR